MPSKCIIAIIGLTIITCFALWRDAHVSIITTCIYGIIGLGGYAIAKSNTTKVIP